ncbi:MAG: hypothetical protein J2P49_11460, partial [Methylocapsa sp.]|nr:hypothetical protein [Methylocapsa sp.]
MTNIRRKKQPLAAAGFAPVLAELAGLGDKKGTSSLVARFENERSAISIIRGGGAKANPEMLDHGFLGVELGFFPVTVGGPCPCRLAATPQSHYRSV